MRGLLANSYAIRVEGAGFLPRRPEDRHRDHRGRRDPDAAAGAGGDRRQHGPASPGVVGRAAQAEVLEDFAARRLQAAVLEAGADEFRQRPAQARAHRRGHDRAVVAGAHAARHAGDARSGGDPADDAERSRCSCSARWSPSSPSSRRRDFLFQYRQWFERQKMSFQRVEGGIQEHRRRSACEGARSARSARAGCASA